jgi:hypothetical protein
MLQRSESAPAGVCPPCFNKSIIVGYGKCVPLLKFVVKSYHIIFIIVDERSTKHGVCK